MISRFFSISFVSRPGFVSRLGLVPLFGLASIAFAGVGPIGYNDAGFNVSVTTVGPDTWLTGINGLTAGGSFMGNEAGSNWIGTVNGVSTWDYCVDDQRNVNVPGSYTANVTLLSNIAGDATSVNLGSTPAADWTTQLAAAENTATARYEMAAWLISNFSPASDGTLTGAGADVAKNQQIQSAIWVLTNNSSYGSLGIAQTTAGGGPNSLTENDTWVAAAEKNYQSVNINGWAVLSFTSGASLASIQTLIVQVTPEPGYSFLVICMVGGLLFMKIRQRRQRT